MSKTIMVDIPPEGQPGVIPFALSLEERRFLRSLVFASNEDESSICVGVTADEQYALLLVPYEEICPMLPSLSTEEKRTSVKRLWKMGLLTPILEMEQGGVTFVLLVFHVTKAPANIDQNFQALARAFAARN